MSLPKPLPVQVKPVPLAIPILEGLREDTQDIQAVIVCPTRELCVQIADELRQLAAFRSEVRIANLYGGQPIAKQLAALDKHPQIVVATPGRLLDHMGRGTAWLGNVYTAVLDEADEMLKMGFIRDVRRILNATPADTQVVMFSATISREVMDVAWEYQRDAVEIHIASEGDNRPRIAQFLLSSVGGARMEDMLRIIQALDLKRVMVFGNRKSTVRILGEQLRRRGCSADCLHGDIPQSQRNKVMKAFREGKFEILVATDVAAAASMWTMWRLFSITISPMKTSITYTASAEPAGPSGMDTPLLLLLHRISSGCGISGNTPTPISGTCISMKQGVWSPTRACRWKRRPDSYYRQTAPGKKGNKLPGIKVAPLPPDGVFTPGINPLPVGYAADPRHKTACRVPV